MLHFLLEFIIKIISLNSKITTKTKMASGECARCGVNVDGTRYVRFTSLLKKSESTVLDALQEIFGKFKGTLPFTPAKIPFHENRVMCRHCAMKLRTLHKLWVDFVPPEDATCYLNEKLKSMSI